MLHFFPAWQWEDFLNYNRGMERYFSCFLDDIKVFEPSEKVDLTDDSLMLQMMWKEKAPYSLSGWFGLYSRQKITEYPTPHSVYIKMTRGVDWHPKKQNKR